MQKNLKHLYFIALVLPRELDIKILAYKVVMKDLFDCKVGLKSPAHITLIPPFILEEEKELQLIRDMDVFSRDINYFPVSTQNFSCFRPRTIFADVAQNEPLHELKKKVDLFFSCDAGYPVKIDKRAFHPHITIATRDLEKKDFGPAWELFETKAFLEEWTVKGLSVLRHNKQCWDVLHTTNFQPYLLI